MSVEVRFVIVTIWMLLAVAGIIMGGIALRYAQGNRNYVMSHSSNVKRRIATTADLVRVWVLVIAAIDLLLIGLVVVIFPSDWIAAVMRQVGWDATPSAVRQWVFTMGLLYLGVAVNAVLLNELTENHKLLRAQEQEDQLLEQERADLRVIDLAELEAERTHRKEK